MSIVHRRNLVALLFALLLNAHGKVLGEDLTWEYIRTNLSNGSNVELQNSVDANNSDVQVTGSPTLIIGGVALTNAILEATSNSTLKLKGTDADSAITGTITAQTRGNVNILSGSFLNLKGAILNGAGTFSNFGTTDLTADNLHSSITNSGTINLTGTITQKQVPDELRADVTFDDVFNTKTYDV